ncbi:hypothetical protein SALBM135S_05621 [Streptomyces alboniger]
MKQKIITLVGAVACGVVIASAAISQASAADRGRLADATSAPHSSVAFGDHVSVSDSGLVAPLGEWGAGRRPPRA